MEQLTPGLYVVARGRDRLQIGLGEHRWTLPRSQESLALLEHLATGRPCRRSEVEPLTAAGVATEGPLPGDDLGRRLALESPADWQHRLQRRSAAVVQVLGDLREPGSEPGSELGVDPRSLLEDSGIASTLTSGPEAGPEAGAGTDPISVVLLLSHGEPDPAYLDVLIRDQVPHLLVKYVDGTVMLGPFVEPGVTACTRCLELHATHDDPEFPDVLRRYREAASLDAHPVAPSRTLVTMAVAWAVRDLAAWIDGDQPTTWSTSIALRASGSPEATSWLRHPHCGCGW